MRSIIRRWLRASDYETALENIVDLYADIDPISLTEREEQALEIARIALIQNVNSNGIEGEYRHEEDATEV